MTATQTMPRFVATRHASFTTLQSTEPETYALTFKWHEGWHYVSVEFKGEWTHDAINVFDNETDSVTIHDWAEFRAVIDEYMSHMDRDEFRKAWHNR